MVCVCMVCVVCVCGVCVWCVCGVCVVCVVCVCVWCVWCVCVSGQYGIPRSWFFPFTKSYWFGEGENRKTKVPQGRKGNRGGDVLIFGV